jgi:hypothetical protein
MSNKTNVKLSHSKSVNEHRGDTSGSPSKSVAFNARKLSGHGKQPWPPLEILVSDWLNIFFIFSSESTKTNELLLCMVDVWETFNKSFSF